MTDSLRDRIAAPQSDTLRDRIQEVIGQELDRHPHQWQGFIYVNSLADVVMREITSTYLMLPCRNCGCPPVRDWSAKDRHSSGHLLPEPHEGSDKMRPFCISCTHYIEWATS